MNEARLEKKFVETEFGRIAYLETGEKNRPTVLFVHGIPTSSYLWRHVLRLLQNGFHCIAPDLMGLGDTEVDAEKGRFTMDAQSEMLAAFMEKLGHSRYAVVCHDQGGAATQLLVTGFPQRIVAYVMTDCVAYDNWPVPVIARMQKLSRLPWVSKFMTNRGIMEWLEANTPLSAFKRGVYDRSKMSEESIAEYLRPLRESEETRQRFQAFLLAGHERYTLEAVPRLKKFDRPTLILWGGDDRYISPSWGWKLYEDIPGAEGFELIPFCGHFWQEERPSEYTSKIAAFLSAKFAADSPAKEAKSEAKPAPAKKRATKKKTASNKPSAA